MDSVTQCDSDMTTRPSPYCTHTPEATFQRLGVTPDMVRHPAVHHMRIGTRASKLAMAQVQLVRDYILAICPGISKHALEIVPIRTSGDNLVEGSLADAGGKGLFTKEIEEALLQGVIDMAVHSMKDVPAALPDGLDIISVLPRANPHDALLCAAGCGDKAVTLERLPKGAVVGTSSVRRQAQLLYHRPDLQVVPFRGNVVTRMEKLANRLVDATLLAVAGLERIGVDPSEYVELSPDVMLPAVAQGAIGIQCCTARQDMVGMISILNHYPTSVCLAAERALLKAFEGNCRTPLGALAVLEGSTITLRGCIARVDGTHMQTILRTAHANDAAVMGYDAGLALKQSFGAS